ncbi:hypothetical protein ACLMJK_002541 [Lecanora helva]
MTEYLTDWWHANSAQCEFRNATFASCYQQMHGYEQEQCDKTGPSMCNYPPDFSKYTVHQAYTLYTIFAIWQWFESIYEAIGNADLSANGRVGKIVKAINPEVHSKQSLGNFLQALSALTPVISAPATLIEQFGKFVGKAITETAMRQSPGVIKQLNPTGTLDSEFVQINDLYDGLATVKETYQQNISAALSLVQENFTTFSLFAADGAFIAPRASLEANTQNLTNSLETYIISQCLTANNMIVTLSRDTNPYELVHNGSLTTSDLVSCDYYDQYGVCSAWWYDPDTNSAYALASLTNPETNYYDLMETMFSEGWTTGKDLFLGANACADHVARNGGKDNGPALDTNTMAPRCVSNVQVCVFDKNCEGMDADCEFTGEYGWDGCHPQPEYMKDECPGSYAEESVALPAAYLGSLDTTESQTIQVCEM